MRWAAISAGVLGVGLLVLAVCVQVRQGPAGEAGEAIRQARQHPDKCLVVSPTHPVAEVRGDSIMTFGGRHRVVGAELVIGGSAREVFHAADPEFPDVIHGKTHQAVTPTLKLNFFEHMPDLPRRIHERIPLRVRMEVVYARYESDDKYAPASAQSDRDLVLWALTDEEYALDKAAEQDAMLQGSLLALGALGVVGCIVMLAIHLAQNKKRLLAAAMPQPQMPLAPPPVAPPMPPPLPPLPPH
jgi:hypothetical protein